MVSNVRGECRVLIRGWDIRRGVGGAGKEGRKRREGTSLAKHRALGSRDVVTFPPDARIAMEEVAAALARNTAELKCRQKQAQKDRAKRRNKREQALLVATMAFSHEPTAGPAIAAATLRKYPNVMEENLETLTRIIETRFLETPVDTLAQWLDWDGVPRQTARDAQRLVDDVRLLDWIGEQNSAQGVSPPPQFVWEKRCALTIDQTSGDKRRAASWRPARSAAAKKWLQRFRKRWNLCLGRLPAKEVLPTATLQAKARSGVTENSNQ